MRAMRWWLGLALASAFGCSALIDPDGSELGGPGGSDGGRDGGMDAAIDAPGMDAAIDVPGIDAPGMDSGPTTCPGAPAQCLGSVLRFCDGDFLRMIECGDDRCDEPTASCIPEGGDRYRPSNVDADFWDDGASDFELDGDAFIDTTICDEGDVVSIGGGVEVCVFSVRNFRASGLVRVDGVRPAVIMATGNVIIDGTLDASGYGQEPGPGGFRGGVADPIDGAGPNGGEAGEHVGEFEDGGGGGGGFCGAGGSGGFGGRGEGGEGGGAVPGGYDLQPLRGGGGGGRGRGFFAEDGRDNAGFGGSGGGAIQISALGNIIVNGRILAGGGGGEGGGNNFGSGANWGSGGGGGAGGGILLEAIEIRGTGDLVAAGGGGGGAAGSGGSGDDGGDGSSADPTASGGAGAPGSGDTNGGRGGGGMQLIGADGDSEGSSPVNGAGGGGGTGCIVLRSDSSAADFFLTPVSEPGLKRLPLQR